MNRILRFPASKIMFFVPIDGPLSVGFGLYYSPCRAALNTIWTDRFNRWSNASSRKSNPFVNPT